MRFENNYGHRFLVQKIYEVSLNRLRGKLADDMVKKYEILRIEFRYVYYKIIYYLTI